MRSASARAPARMWARIGAGSSEWGVSSVTITTSAARAAIAPITGRLSRSRSPAEPNTIRVRPRVPAAARASARERSAWTMPSGLCAKSTTASGSRPTTSIRPGTAAARGPSPAGTSRTAASASRCSSPTACSTSRTARAALATLKRPGRPTEARSSRPVAAWRSVKRWPRPSGASSATSQSARRPGSWSARAPGVGAAGPRASVVTGAPAARAMATPQRGPSPPSSVMTAWSVRAGSNRPALAAKYSCIEPCMSRWSWVRLVNPATA